MSKCRYDDDPRSNKELGYPMICKKFWLRNDLLLISKSDYVILKCYAELIFIFFLTDHH